MIHFACCHCRFGWTLIKSLVPRTDVLSYTRIRDRSPSPNYMVLAKILPGLVTSTSHNICWNALRIGVMSTNAWTAQIRHTGTNRSWTRDQFRAHTHPFGVHHRCSTRVACGSGAPLDGCRLFCRPEPRNPPSSTCAEFGASDQDLHEQKQASASQPHGSLQIATPSPAPQVNPPSACFLQHHPTAHTMTSIHSPNALPGRAGQHLCVRNLSCAGVV